MDDSLKLMQRNHYLEMHTRELTKFIFSDAETKSKFVKFLVNSQPESHRRFCKSDMCYCMGCLNGVFRAYGLTEQDKLLSDGGE